MAKMIPRWLDDEMRIYKMLWFVFNQLPKKKQELFWQEWTGAEMVDEK